MSVVEKLVANFLNLCKIPLKGLFWRAYFREGGGLITRGSFALQNWLGLYFEGILRLKMGDFATENAVQEEMWVQGGGQIDL